MGENAEWFLGDALGSVRQLVEDDGAVVLARDYEPYGQVLSESGTGSSGYGFTGEQYALGLVYLRARHYDPRVGRLLSEDQWPADAYDPASLHLYVYVGNNPLRYVDPYGHQRIVILDRPSPKLDITAWPGWAKGVAFVLTQFTPFFSAHYEAHYEESGRTIEGWEVPLTTWIEREFRARGVDLEEPRIVVRGLSRVESVQVCMVQMVRPTGWRPATPPRLGAVTEGHHWVPQKYRPLVRAYYPEIADDMLNLTDPLEVNFHKLTHGKWGGRVYDYNAIVGDWLEKNAGRASQSEFLQFIERHRSLYLDLYDQYLSGG